MEEATRRMDGKPVLTVKTDKSGYKLIRIYEHYDERGQLKLTKRFENHRLVSEQAY